MATQTQKTQTSMSPLDNVTYDVITVLHEKAKAMEHYEKYLQDVRGNEEVRKVFEEIRQQEAQQIEKLRGCLVDLLVEDSQSEEEGGGQAARKGGSSGGSKSRSSSRSGD